jgi:hypothetical protein
VQLADEPSHVVNLQIAELCFVGAREQRLDVAAVGGSGMLAQTPFMREVFDVALQQVS